MKIYYTGKTDVWLPTQQRKVETKFAKLARMLDMKQGEREAHVILKGERHLRHAEIKVRFHDHNLVGIGSGADDFLAMQEALEKLEKQVLKLRTKWRDIKRSPKPEWPEEEAAEETAGESASPEPAASRLFRVIDSHDGRKPMTLEEALLEMRQDRDYMIYRDAETNRLSVLVRRRDGLLDLIRS